MTMAIVGLFENKVLIFGQPFLLIKTFLFNIDRTPKTSATLRVVYRYAQSPLGIPPGIGP